MRENSYENICERVHENNSIKKDRYSTPDEALKKIFGYELAQWRYAYHV